MTDNPMTADPLAPRFEDYFRGAALELAAMNRSAEKASVVLAEIQGIVDGLVHALHRPRRRIARGMRKAIRRASGVDRARLKEAGLRRQLNTRA